MYGCLEELSIQKIHKQIGVISLPPAVRTDGTRWNKQKLIQEFGFPVLSKEIARKIELLQNPTPNNKTIRHAIVTGETGEYGGFQKHSKMKLAQKWLEKFGGLENEEEGVNYQIAPFKVSSKCCYYLKEKPCSDWAKEHNCVPYLGLMASEGGRREKSLMLNGCNYFGKGKFQVFEDIIKEIMIVYKHDSRPWLIGYSGGKDSTLLVSLVYEAMKRLKDAGAKLDKTVHVITSDTMVENPIVKNYMHSSSDNINRAAGKDRLNIKASVIYPEPEQTFWSRVIGLGYPTPEPPGFRWCTDRLKIMPMNKFVNERIKESGEIIILLGVRKGESLTRMKTITAREIEGKLLNMHNDIPNAYVYNPITEIPNDLVWEFLLKGDCRSPWGSDMKYLFSLYQGENLGEEKSVLGEVDREKIPVTGNSRFGCWCCTMVKEDKSLQNFINKGATELIPLREFRNELLRMRENSQYRDSKRRNGSVYKKSDGSFGMGPFTLEARCLILEKLLDLENRTGMELITEAELKAIDKMWDEEGDLTCRALVETYHKVKGKKLPWDDYKTPRFDDEAIQAIRDVADKYDIPVELITKLIVSVDTNKHITKNNKMQKAFDSIIGQGWLHYNSVEGALNHED